MFPVDEHGDLVDGSQVTEAMANSLLRKSPGSTILYNLIVSKSVPELIERLGGKGRPYTRRTLIHQGRDA